MEYNNLLFLLEHEDQETATSSSLQITQYSSDSSQYTLFSSIIVLLLVFILGFEWLKSSGGGKDA